MSNPDLAAQRASDLINDAERAMDAAMAAASRLVSELPALQRDAGLNAAWAQPAVTAVCLALTDLTSARASIIVAHRSLSAVQRKLRLTVMETPNNTKQDDAPLVRPTGSSDPRVVALRA